MSVAEFFYSFSGIVVSDICNMSTCMPCEGNVYGKVCFLFCCCCCCFCCCLRHVHYVYVCMPFLIHEADMKLRRPICYIEPLFPCGREVAESNPSWQGGRGVTHTHRPLSLRLVGYATRKKSSLVFYRNVPVRQLKANSVRQPLEITPSFWSYSHAGQCGSIAICFPDETWIPIP